MPNNSQSLTKAHTSKMDEFYTIFEDIEKEIPYYTNQFYNKIVYCNCDNPLYSNFFKYFLLNFKRLNLKKLICTCYDSGISLWEDDAGYKKAYKFMISSPVFENPDNISINEVDSFINKTIFSDNTSYVTYLNGNGDFRSQECIDLLKESDIIVTNPPFSLFRDFIKILIKYNKQFLVLGNINALASKDIFKLFKENKIRLGETIHSGDRKFYVPDDYPLEAYGCGIDEYGKRYIRVKGIRWYTNLNSSTKKEFLKTDCFYYQNKDSYPVYENYNAINVDKTNEIPMDYDEEMGVPITFLDKYNPEQFKIIGADFELSSPVIKPDGKIGKGRFYLKKDNKLECLYARIVIKRRI